MEQAKTDSIFRKTTMEKVSSPERLSDYLRVTNPGVWAVLAVVLLLLAGLLVWASVGTLETTAEVRVIVHEQRGTDHPPRRSDAGGGDDPAHRRSGIPDRHRSD